MMSLMKVGESWILRRCDRIIVDEAVRTKDALKKI